MTKKPHAGRGRRYHEIAALRAAVHAASWDELRSAVGPQLSEQAVQRLRRITDEPDQLEASAREAFARLRSALLEAVALGRWRRAAERRFLHDEAEPPGGAECARCLELPLLEPLTHLLKDHKMRVSRAWFAALDDPQDLEELLRATRREQKRAPRWQLPSKRARLVSALDRLNLLSLPRRTTAPFGSRFFSVREFALLSLILDAGILDEEVVAKSMLRAGITVAAVIVKETERMRLTLRRHGVQPNEGGAPIRGPDTHR